MESFPNTCSRDKCNRLGLGCQRALSPGLRHCLWVSHWTSTLRVMYSSPVCCTQLVWYTLHTPHGFGASAWHSACGAGPGTHCIQCPHQPGPMSRVWCAGWFGAQSSPGTSPEPFPWSTAPNEFDTPNLGQNCNYEHTVEAMMEVKQNVAGELRWLGTV